MKDQSQVVLKFLIFFSSPFFLIGDGYAQSPIQALWEDAQELNYSGIYNGVYYQLPRSLGNGYPFYETQNWLKASVSYNGEWFDEVPVIYDLLNDKLIIQNNRKEFAGQPVLQDQSLFDEFILDGHRFINRQLRSDSFAIDGWMEVLYDGKSLKLYAKRSVIENVGSGRRLVYEEVSNFYLDMGGQLSIIKRRKDFLTLLPNLKQELRDHIRLNRVKGDNQQSFTNLSQFCDQLL